MTTSRPSSAPHRRRLAGAILAALGVVLGPALPAAAHAGLVAASPAPGTVLVTSPAAVQLRFDEPVSVVTAAFVLYDSHGRYVGDGPARPAAVGVEVLGPSVTVSLPPALPRGSYLLTWRVVSRDAHPVSGAANFAVGAASASAPAAPAAETGAWGRATPAAFLGLQVLVYLGVCGAVGLAVFGVFVLPAPARSGRIRFVPGAVAVAALASVLLVAVTGLRARGEPLSGIVGPSAWVSGLTGTEGVAAGLVLTGGLLLTAVARYRRRPVARVDPAAVTVVAGAALMLSSVLLTGHTRTADPRWLMVAADFAHVAAASVWFGGLLGLVAYLVRARRRQEPETAARTLARFSAVAGVAVVLLGVSGLAMAAVILPSFGAVFSSAYGRALLVKLSLVAVVAVLAIWNRAALVTTVLARPTAQARWRRLRSAVIDEAAIVVVALAITAVLTTLSPPAARSDPGPGDLGAGSQRVALSTGGGSVSLQVLPGRVGANSLEISVRGADGAPLSGTNRPVVRAVLPADDVGPIPARVQRLPGVGRYRAEVQLPLPGQWRFLVSVPMADGFDNPTAVAVVSVRS